MVDLMDRPRKPKKRVVKVYETGTTQSPLGKFSLTQQDGQTGVFYDGNFLPVEENEKGRSGSYHLRNPEDVRYFPKKE